MKLNDVTRRSALADFLPSAVVASAGAGTAADPIFSIIENHRELSARYEEAVCISGDLEPGPEFDAAGKVTGRRSEDLIDHADLLISSEPATIAGIIALTRYVSSLDEWQTPAGLDWHQALLITLADALDKIGAQRLIPCDRLVGSRAPASGAA
ncbi:hypothetical protein ABIE88_006263 [Bradyrhizobium diazoefficiens]|uniref:hypothetical protein n=1 Tax=Bradyrhizobium diazoefficiens TaxID=1355477 RepID=UPI003513783D